MSFAAAFLLATAAAQAAPFDVPSAPDRGPQMETARVSATILRAAVLKNGSLIESRDGLTPRSQRQSRDGRVTYEFE
jgi:hypothetical protein